MDRIKEFHRKISVYLPKQKHFLFIVFYPRFEKEIKKEFEKVKNDEIIEVKIKTVGILSNENSYTVKKFYVALLKVLMKKYRTAERVWEEIQKWKKKSIFHFV